MNTAAALALATFKEGDMVERRLPGKLAWTGIVLAVFCTRDGEVRYVVERMNREHGAALQVYSAGQLREVHS